MANIDFKKDLKELLEGSQSWALKEIKKNENEFRKELGINEIVFGPDNTTKLLKLALDKMNAAEDFDQYQKFKILYTALLTVDTFLKIDLNKIDDCEAVMHLYWLGRVHGSLESVVPKLMPSKLYEDHFFSQKSKSSIKKRWDKQNKKLKEAIGIAIKKWENRDPALHHEMAEHLNSKFPDLSYEVLKKALKPVAKKYDRLFGVKGVKKEI